MRVTIKKGSASGRITAPPSKSMAHRLLISASMADGISHLSGISDCEDVAATLDCLRSLGVRVSVRGSDITVYGRDMRDAVAAGILRCRESGSTLRFMIPIAMLSGNTVMFSGEGKLMSRPMDVYKTIAKEKGLVFIEDGSTITVKGPITSGEYSVVGNISSQFISGLLFVLPLLEGDSKIRITPPIESRSYIEMTRAAIAEFGIRTEWSDDHTLMIPGGQKYISTDLAVEGDWSGAAFPDALNLFGGDVKIEGLYDNTLQGDSIYRKYYEMLSVGVPTIHIGDCPDLGPILFAIAGAKCGGVFSGTRRLKIKESDRAAAMAEELAKFGISVKVFEDKVVVYPADFHKPTEALKGHNDHRIVMALAILATLVGAEIEGAEAIAKSYPSFFEDLSALGIEVVENDA